MSRPSLLPSNATALELAIERLIVERFDFPLVLGTLWNPDTCPEPFLKYMAWALSVDVWDPKWPVATRRRMIRTSLEVHFLKGTLPSMKLALLAAGYGDATIFEAKDLPRIGAAPPLGSTWKLGGAGVHWADYWIEVMQPITRREAERLVQFLKTFAPVHCRLRSILVRNVQFTIGDGLWTVGTDIALGATYEMELE